MLLDCPEAIAFNFVLLLGHMLLPEKKGTPHISMQPICIRDKYITNRGCDTFSTCVCG